MNRILKKYFSHIFFLSFPYKILNIAKENPKSRKFETHKGDPLFLFSLKMKERETQKKRIWKVRIGGRGWREKEWEWDCENKDWFAELGIELGWADGSVVKVVCGKKSFDWRRLGGVEGELLSLQRLRVRVRDYLWGLLGLGLIHTISQEFFSRV